MNVLWQKFLTLIPRRKKKVAERLLTAINHDAGIEVTSILEKYFEGKNGLTKIQMLWRPSNPLIAQQHGLDKSTEFDSDLLSVLYQNMRINIVQTIASKGWLDGNEWVWYGHRKTFECIFASPLKNAVFSVPNGNLFWSQKNDALKQIWGPKPGEYATQWLCDQILFATTTWETAPCELNKLKQPNWCPPPTKQTIESWIRKEWIHEKNLVEAQETLLRKYTNIKTKKGIKITEVIPKELLAKYESILLRSRTTQPKIYNEYLYENVL